MRRLAIITTHPIQYNAPWFRQLADRKLINPKVFYTWSQVQSQEKYDPGFGRVIEWDIPLLSGYEYTFVENTSKRPGSKTFNGIDNPTLIPEIVAWDPDAILVFGWKFRSHWAVMRHFHGRIPLLFRGDSTTLLENRGWRKWLRKRVLRRVYRKVDYALYVGQENKKYFLGNGLAEEQLVFAPHAIDNQHFQNAQYIKRGHELRERLQISPGAVILLFAGKFEPIKNPLILRKAVEALNEEDVHLVFVGNGPLEEELKLDAPGNIHFMNFQNQSEIPAVYKMADILVVPSVSETWGLAVNEAMAAGKPVLVSDRCGCAADLVEEGVTGYTFRANDIQHLIRKIKLAVSDKSHLKDMGLNANLKIQDWSFATIVQAVENLIISTGK